MSQSPGNSTLQVTRRAFLMGGGAGVVLAQNPLLSGELADEPATHRFRIRRDTDLLSLQISFVHFERRDDYLHSLGGGRALVVVRFPPQNLAEARFDKAGAAEEPNEKPEFQPRNTFWEEQPLPLRGSPEGHSAAAPIPCFLSGPSWIVFTAPDGIRIPLTVNAARELHSPCGLPFATTASIADVWLQMFGDWPIRVPERAVDPGPPQMPTEHETCLEIPFRLFIAPKSKTAKWITSSTPQPPFVGVTEHVEHWHAALHDRTKLTPAVPPPDLTKLPPELSPPKVVTVQARAVYSPDYQENGQPAFSQFYPGNKPLSHRALVRHLLVRQMMIDRDGWIDADHLVLSPLGADASLSYYMQKTFRQIHDTQIKEGLDAPHRTDLTIWKHRMVVGRDVFLLSVYPMFAFPFVLPSLLVELTRRTIVSRQLTEAPARPDGNGNLPPFSAPGAYLLTEYFILIQDPVKQFSDSGNVLGRKMPIKKAVVLEERSPLIAPPADINEPFIPLTLDGRRPLRWSVELEDERGRKSTTDACLMFSSNVVSGHKAWEDPDHKAWMGRERELRRWAASGQRVGLAPEQPRLVIPSRFNQASTGHELSEGERKPAVEAAKALRALTGDNPADVADRFRELQRIADAPDAFPEEVRGHIGRLSATTRQFVQKLALELNSEARNYEDATGQVLAQLSSADRLFGEFGEHRFDTDEAKEAAFKAAELLQQELDAGTITAKTLCHKLVAGDFSTFSEAAKAELQKIKSAWPTLGKVADELGAAKATAQRGFDQIMRQLSRAEQAASDVEVHAIEFGSRSVHEVFHHLRGDIPAALTGAASPAAFLAQLRSLTDDSSEIKRLEGEVNALWSGAKGDWSHLKGEALNFLREMQAEGKQATNFLRHGFQTQFTAADIVVPALQVMGGGAAPRELKLLEGYAAKGIDKIQNSVFGEFSQNLDEGRAMADRVKCAVASPAAKIAGLSRDLGALAGGDRTALQRLAEQSDNFDLSDAIPDFKLLGVLPLSKIISSVLGGDQLPTINLITLPDHLEHVWEWNAKLKEVNLGIVTFKTSPTPKKPDNGGASPPARKEPVHLYIKMTTRINLPKPAQVAAETGGVRGKVRLEGVISLWNRASKKPIILKEYDGLFSFSLNLLELIEIKFIDVGFEADYLVGENPKPKVKPRLGEVQFLPPLDFVAKLQKMLPFLGKGFDVVQSPGRIGISYEFKVPAITTGAFAIRNLAIGASVLFSLEGKPLRFDFNFSSWKEPFEITVMCFGGRGFLKIAVDTSGYRDLQGMLEFGGSLAFDVAVASGGLYVMAGVYFRITPTATTVSGFVRAGGCVSVLGLIHASIEFLLMLSYVRSDRGKLLAGEASVTVSIDLFLVSYNVSIRMYKEFAGSGESDESTAALPHAGTTRYVGLNAPATPPVVTPEAYLRRGPHVPGRFDSDAQWLSEYWSRFAL